MIDLCPSLPHSAPASSSTTNDDDAEQYGEWNMAAIMSLIHTILQFTFLPFRSSPDRSFLIFQSISSIPAFRFILLRSFSYGRTMSCGLFLFPTSCLRYSRMR